MYINIIHAAVGAATTYIPPYRTRIEKGCSGFKSASFLATATEAVCGIGFDGDNPGFNIVVVTGTKGAGRTASLHRRLTKDQSQLWVWGSWADSRPLQARRAQASR